MSDPVRQNEAVSLWSLRARVALKRNDTHISRDMGMDWWSEQAEGLRQRIESGQPFKWFAPYVDGPPTS